MSERILVIGSTGKVGGELVKILTRNRKTFTCGHQKPIGKKQRAIS